MNLPFSYRQTALLIALLPAGLLGFGYYLQYAEGLEPCPLCMTQRICFYLVGLFVLLSVIKHRSQLWQRISNGLAMLSAITGMLVAGRQLWLQSLPPDQVPACGPDLAYMLKTFPLLEAVSIMFKGNGNCAEVDWTLLGLSIAGWAFICFTALLLLTTLQALRRVR
ncbi:MAG TPA: disulfide bond formation protein B [Pseudomonadales bacterium]